MEYILSSKPSLLTEKFGETGKVIKTFTGHSGVVTSLTMVNADTLASASDDKTVKFWDLETGTVITTLKGHSDSVTSLTMVDADILGSASHDNTVKLWNWKTGTVIRTSLDIQVRLLR